MLYARDHIPGGGRDPILVPLDEPDAPLDLWCISVEGISRPRECCPPFILRTAASSTVSV
jgi:hypothetical protein